MTKERKKTNVKVFEFWKEKYFSSPWHLWEFYRFPRIDVLGKFLRILSSLQKCLFEISATKITKVRNWKFWQNLIKFVLFLDFDRVEKIFLKNFQSLICPQISWGCWYNLIGKLFRFQIKIINFLNTILIAYLNTCTSVLIDTIYSVFFLIRKKFSIKTIR